MNTKQVKIAAGKPLVLIEIGNDRLKMMRVVPRADGIPDIEQLHVEPIRSTTANPAPAIARVLQSWPKRPAPVILVLPRQLVTIRNLELPSADRDEIAAMVEIQAGKLTPWSREEIGYDYRRMDAGRPGYSRLMLVIAQCGVFRQPYSIAEEAGAAPQRLTISVEGLLLWTLRTLRPGTEDAPVAVLDVDSFYSDFLVVRNARPLYSRGILTGAERLRDDPDARNQLAREVAQSLELAARESGDAAPGRIVVTGAVRQDDGLIEQLQNETGRPCEWHDSLELVRSKNKKFLQTNRKQDDMETVLATTSITSMIGMATTPDQLEINLLPESVRLRRGILRRAEHYAGFGTALMAVLVAASFLAHVWLFKLTDRRDQIRTALAQTTMDADRVTLQHDVTVQAYRYLDASRTPIPLLSAVHACLSNEIALEEIEWNAGLQRLTLNGTAVSIRDVRAFLNAIAEMPGFHDVREDGSMIRDPRSGRFKFKIVCALDPAE